MLIAVEDKQRGHDDFVDVCLFADFCKLLWIVVSGKIKEVSEMWITNY